ncbi:MAG: hypothetical protein AAB353_13800 [Candidatus Hydrogenedentota bacterium]
MPAIEPQQQLNYAFALLSHWKVIVGATAAGVLLGLVSSPIVPQPYEATANVLILPPPFKELPSEETDAAMPKQSMGELMPRTLPMEAYKTLAESKQLMAAVLRDANVEDITIEELEESTDARLTPLGSRTATFGTQYSPAITLSVTALSPETAAALASTWAKTFKEQVDIVMNAGLDESYALVSGTYTGSETELITAEDALDTFQKEWNLRLMKAQIEGKELEATNLEKRVTELTVQAEGARASLESVQAELAKEVPIQTLWKAPPDEAYWLSPRGADASTKPLGPESGLKTEQINPNYTTFREKEVMASSNLQGLEQEKMSAASELETLKAAIRTDNETYVSRNTEQDRLLRKVESLRRGFDLASRTLEKSKIAKLGNSSDIRIVGEVVIPEKSSGIGLLYRLAAGGIVGGFVGCVSVLVFELKRALDARPAPVA